MHPLVAALAATMPREGWWFPTASASGHVHRCSVSSAIKRAMVRAGVPGTPHAARHHYGTQVLRASGGDLRTAQRALRHASVQTTAIYTQVPDDALRRAITGIPAA
jgi:site-specific recombinase XerD